MDPIEHDKFIVKTYFTVRRFVDEIELEVKDIVEKNINKIDAQ